MNRFISSSLARRYIRLSLLILIGYCLLTINVSALKAHAIVPSGAGETVQAAVPEAIPMVILDDSFGVWAIGGDYLYWADCGSTHVLKRRAITGGDTIVIDTVSSSDSYWFCDRLEADEDGVYYLGSDGLMMAPTDEPASPRLLDAGGTYVLSLFMKPAGDHVYYTTSGELEPETMWRVPKDGSQTREQVVVYGLSEQSPNDLILDAGQLYWIDDNSVWWSDMSCATLPCSGQKIWSDGGEGLILNGFGFSENPRPIVFVNEAGQVLEIFCNNGCHSRLIKANAPTAAGLETAFLSADNFTLGRNHLIWVNHGTTDHLYRMSVAGGNINELFVAGTLSSKLHVDADSLYFADHVLENGQYHSHIYRLRMANYANTDKTTINYAADPENIPNPERGWYRPQISRASNPKLWTSADFQDALNWNSAIVDETESTMLLCLFYLDEFQNSSISQSFLDNIQTNLNTARDAGQKCVVRFAYTDNDDIVPYQDASKARILEHIEQLTPIFQDNSDIISVMQSGFIGVWGEWYYTNYFADPNNPVSISPAQYADRLDVVTALLNGLPTNRMVQIRTPYYKKNMLNRTTPLTESEAHNGSDVARMGGHNDCFVSSGSDYGTFLSQADRDYWMAETQFMPMGGETCAPSGSADTSCANALERMANEHWSYINAEYEPSILSGWEADNCLEEIQQRLGYRFVMTQGVFSDSVTPGGVLDFSLRIKNEGFAAPYNPRNVILILRNVDDGTEYEFPLNEDPRFWWADGAHRVNQQVVLPETLPQGHYQLLLHLPDPETTLADRPEYAIRLANANAWESATGYNDLQHILIVDERQPTDPLPAPQLGTISNSSSKDFVIGWRDVAGATLYELQESRNQGAWAVIGQESSHTYAIYNKPTGSWCYRLRAINVNAISPYSNVECTNTDLKTDTIDVSISLHHEPGAPVKPLYETVLKHFADGIFEMTNGAHRIGRITIYQNGENKSSADVVWNQIEWPRATVSGYHFSGRVWMGDVFPFNSGDYNALLPDNLVGTGYTLAHEFGHFYYGLRDEYANDAEEAMGDVDVVEAVMSSQWCAAPNLGGDLDCLNFSTSLNNNAPTNKQFRSYNASAWDTLTRPTFLDPEGAPRRVQFHDLLAVDPENSTKPVIDLPNAASHTELEIIWREPSADRTAIDDFSASIRALEGSFVAYPQPAVIVAQMLKNDPIANASVVATVTKPDTIQVALTLLDDGIAPDETANDGLYTGYLPYDQDGAYAIEVAFDNASGDAYETNAAIGVQSPDGDTMPLMTNPVVEAFNETAVTSIVVSNYVVDDHANQTGGATVISADNTPTTGRIDNAGDVDLFQITPTTPQSLYLRLSNLAMGMAASIEVYAADGTTLLDNFTYTPNGDYFFEPLTVTVDEPIYIAISHSSATASDGTYTISVGSALRGEITPYPNELSVRIVDANDDVEENKATGVIYVDSSDLEIGGDASNPSQIVGLRFQNIDLPPNAIITDAWLLFTVDEAWSMETSATIFGQSSGNAAPFSTVANDVSNRPKTTAAVAWDTIRAWESAEVGTQVASPSLTTIVQEIVNQPDWADGNSLVIMIDGEGRRTAESYDGDAANAPQLQIRYTILESVPTAVTMTTHSNAVSNITPLVIFALLLTILTVVGVIHLRHQ